MPMTKMQVFDTPSFNFFLISSFLNEYTCKSHKKVIDEEAPYEDKTSKEK